MRWSSVVSALALLWLVALVPGQSPPPANQLSPAKQPRAAPPSLQGPATPATHPSDPSFMGLDLRKMLEDLPRKQIYDIHSATEAALQDILTNVPIEARPYTRYLALYHMAKQERREHLQTLNFLSNSLSFQAQIKQWRAVPGTNFALIAIDIRYYGWKAEAWENLVKEDTYFHATLVSSVQRFDAQGKALAGQKIFSDQPSINIAHVTDLKIATRSIGPVLLGDWFLSRVCQPPHYYAFAGIGNKEADFQARVDGRPADAEKYQADRAGIVLRSGITVKNRRLTRIPTMLGAYWFSTDAANGTGAQDYTHVLLERGQENFDASEQIASLPNGLQVYGLFNNKGDRVNTAPSNIASDGTAAGNLRDVIAGKSCMVCHNTGILSFRSVFGDLVGPTLDIKSTRLDKLQRLNQLYDQDLDDLFTADQIRYAKAVRAATKLHATPGLSAEANALQFARIYNGYVEDVVTPTKAALELGIPADKMVYYLKASGNRAILNLLKPNTKGVPRYQWEQAVPEAIDLIAKKRLQPAQEAPVTKVLPNTGK